MTQAPPDRRMRILEAAHEVLLHYGPRKTTIGDIARAAGVAVGSVYLEFPSKDALLAALFGARLERAVVRARAAARVDPPDQAVRAVIEARTEVYRDAGRGGAHARETAHPYCRSVEAAWAAHRGAIRDVLAEVVARGVEQGVIAPGDPKRVATTLMNAYSMFEPPRLFDFEAQQLRASLDAMHALVLDGLRAR